MKRSIEAQEAVFRKPELTCQPHVAVAAPARGADVTAAHGRRRIAGRQNGVLAVTVGANGSLRHAAGDRFSVHAHLIFAGHITVAHAAGLCHSGTKGGGLCDLDFMGRAMAGAAFWRGGVAFADFLTVNAGLGIPSRWGYSSCFTWHVLQDSAACALFSIFCPTSWQEEQAALLETCALQHVPAPHRRNAMQAASAARIRALDGPIIRSLPYLAKVLDLDLIEITPVSITPLLLAITVRIFAR